MRNFQFITIPHPNKKPGRSVRAFLHSVKYLTEVRKDYLFIHQGHNLIINSFSCKPKNFIQHIKGG